MSDPILLNSRQMAEFAARGFLRMDSVVPEEINQQFLDDIGHIDEGEVENAGHVLNLGGTVPGDCNGDGAINAADLTCVSDIAERDIVLGALNTLPGDLDGNGDVAFADFLVLSANFGMAGGYTQGNIDLVDAVAFADFLVLSANFGKTPGATAASIPEPAGSVLATLSLLIGLCSRPRRHNSS